MYKLRDYQQQAVDETIKHFRRSNEPAVIVLPTGAGKSLVIAELARLARQKILVLAHVKELVEQNHEKYESFGLTASIFSAGLSRKDNELQVTFASVQSVACNLELFKEHYSLIIIDECHRVSDDENSQYQQIIATIKESNASLKVLGLTATPYRTDKGWIYQYHYHGMVRGNEDSPFRQCIFELPLRYMIKNKFLTPPEVIDAAVVHYDFSSLWQTSFTQQALNTLLSDQKRATRSIIEHVVSLSEHRKGIMIFAATVEHAKEIAGYLPKQETALITGDTAHKTRDTIIREFKQQSIKYLVNVSVLTTGFDAPHVDVIAILRPTESVSLYQQIAGRGLRLAPEKSDCLIIDYAGNNMDLFHPEPGQGKPDSDSEPVQVMCPACGFGNMFWGKTDGQGNVTEHYGRRCQGFETFDDGQITTRQQCDFRFKFKQCEQCGAENDIAARVCHSCQQILVDPDDKLRAALQLKDAMVIRCAGVSLTNKDQRLIITYHDEQGTELTEQFDFNNKKQLFIFQKTFLRRIAPERSPKQGITIQEVLTTEFPKPDFVIARKKKLKFQKVIWQVNERIFDYKGAYRKANQI